MPKNTKGGKKHKRGKNYSAGEKRELVFREEGQEYAQVTKLFGCGRVEVTYFNGDVKLATIRGSMRKRIWIGVGDTVLVSEREFEDKKVDIMFKYFPEEVRNLKAYGEIPKDVVINEDGEDSELEIVFWR